VLRPGFEPGSSARKAEILNQTILGRKGAMSFLLPEPKPEHQPHKPYLRFNFSPSEGYLRRRRSSTYDLRRSNTHLIEMLFICVDSKDVYESPENIEYRGYIA
jgi:hypothetical protein